MTTETKAALRDLGIFEHPNPGKAKKPFKCVVCGTSKDEPVVLVKIYGTVKDGICEAEQVHLRCLLDSIWYYRQNNAVFAPTLNGAFVGRTAEPGATE